MKIQLKSPYDKDWKCGYLVTNKDNRRQIILYNDNRNRSTTSYARYLMSCKLGYYVPDEYEVDHIDNDKTNDSLDNLQLLSKKDNVRKYSLLDNPAKLITLVCPVCSTEFQRPKNRAYSKTRLGKEQCCSRECGNIKGNTSSNLCKPKSQDVVDKIKAFRGQGFSSYRIAKELKISRNTVMKYW